MWPLFSCIINLTIKLDIGVCQFFLFISSIIDPLSGSLMMPILALEFKLEFKLGGTLRIIWRSNFLYVKTYFVIMQFVILRINIIFICKIIRSLVFIFIRLIKRFIRMIQWTT